MYFMMLLGPSYTIYMGCYGLSSTVVAGIVTDIKNVRTSNLSCHELYVEDPG